jgi:hypothetical protein
MPALKKVSATVKIIGKAFNILLQHWFMPIANIF